MPKPLNHQIALRVPNHLIHDAEAIAATQRQLCDFPARRNRINRSTVLRQAIEAGMIILRAHLRPDAPQRRANPAAQKRA